jgi:hypothetical protein
MQAFKPDYLRRFFPEMRKITERLKSRWSTMAESGQAIDVHGNVRAVWCRDLYITPKSMGITDNFELLKKLIIYRFN